MTARKITLDPAAPPAPQNGEDEAARLARYRALVQEGLDDLEAGRFEIVEDVDAWFDQLEAELDDAARVA